MGKLWRGELSLPVTYWVFGVLLGIPFRVAEKSMDAMDPGLLIAVGLLALAYSVVIWVAIWRSASNYIVAKGEEGKNAFWGYAAKVITVLSIVAAVAAMVAEFNGTV